MTFNEYLLLIIPGYQSWCTVVHCHGNGIQLKLLIFFFLPLDTQQQQRFS